MISLADQSVSIMVLGPKNRETTANCWSKLKQAGQQPCQDGANINFKVILCMIRFFSINEWQRHTR